MPGRVQESPYNRIPGKELHPTFGAEISGIDFSQPIDDETFHEVLEAISKCGHFFTTSGGRITNLSSMAFASFVRRSTAIKHT
jgi:alpha-ketoglutarate-dependent 2,4-dichlorophenoxyacetate dioxygenase